MPFNNLSSEFGRFFNYGDKEPIENYTKANVTIQNIGINKNKRIYSMELVKENLLKRNELLKNNSFVYENNFNGFEPGKIADFNNGISLYTMCAYPRGYGRLSLPLFLYPNACQDAVGETTVEIFCFPNKLFALIGLPYLTLIYIFLCLKIGY